MHTVYSIGYQGVSPLDLQSFVEAHNLRLVDIRHVPRARVAAYNRNALRDRFGMRYLHVADLGNKNYKSGPIDLVNAEAGLATLRVILTSTDIALLCVCADWQTCHRTVVTDALAKEGYPIVRPTVQGAAAAAPRPDDPSTGRLW